MKKSKYACIWIICIIASIALIVLLITTKNSSSTNIIKICCNVETANTCFDIEIANNDELRSLWLMFRENLPDGSWMLFTYDKPSTYSFWMKNTLIPLAWIRLDPDLKIVDIILMDPCKTQECPSYKPKSEAQYVLEINQWLISKKWLLKIWEKCKLSVNEPSF
jgi:uncharacterized membrane protein (UPF0127 family)